MKLRSSNLANGSSVAGFTSVVKKFPWTFCLGRVTLLKILDPFNISGMKLHCLNLASGSTTASPTLGVKISPRKGRGLSHVIVFGVKQRSLNFANASTMAITTPGYKNPPEIGVASVTWTLFKF